MARRKNKLNVIYAISLGAHLAVGGVLALVPQKKLREVVAIALSEAPEKAEKKPEPPKPAERPAERPARSVARAPRSAPAPQAAAAANAQAPAFTDLGLTLDSASSDGLAVNMAPAAASVAPKPLPLVAAKPRLLRPKQEDVCQEPLIKARPLDLARPAYTEEARRARVQGRVRIALAIDDQGAVTDARVLDGLGYGLDEAALVAAKRVRFAPARQCQRAVSAPFVISMRFVLET